MPPVAPSPAIVSTDPNHRRNRANHALRPIREVTAPAGRKPAARTGEEP
ncbi:hypothetical protein LC55x_4789 [Lysobacter capsici]|nr:hypothetical protein LC55x_4789 [Lysobacter capsici]